MSIKRNTMYNIGGALVPLALTLLAVPRYLHVIGEARYGVLSLMWLLLGYFGVFDLGLSTATANALARSRVNHPADRAPIFLTSLLTNFGLGVAIGTVTLAVAPFFITRLGHMTPQLHAEVLAALPWLALSVPLVTAGGVLSGTLIAHERFGTVNLINLCGTAAFQLAPLWAAYAVGPSLSVIVPVAVLARAIPTALTALAALRLIPLKGARYDRAILRALLAYGGWVMVTNLISPILVSVDQFMIAGLLSAGAVAQYSIAYGLAVRLQILPSALLQTMFPRLSQHGGDEARALAVRGLQATMLAMTILCVPAILLARPFLAMWINPSFAMQAGPVAEILLVSVWTNGLAFTPYVLLQAQGRPDTVAKFHALEIVPFLVLLVFGIHFFGLIGAALAWWLRTLLDAVLLFRAAKLPPAAFRWVSASVALLLAAGMVAELQLLGRVELLLLAVLTGLAIVWWGITVDPTLNTVAMQLRGRLHRPVV